MFYYPQKLNGEAEVSCLEEQLHSKSNAFAALRKENMEYEQNVEDYKTRISERYNVKDKACRETCSIIYWILLHTAVGHVFGYHCFTACFIIFLLVRKQ